MEDNANKRSRSELVAEEIGNNNTGTHDFYDYESYGKLTRIVMESLHSSKKEEVLAALEELYAWLLEGKGGREQVNAFVDLGAPAVFLIVMRNWEDDDDIQLLCLRIVRIALKCKADSDAYQAFFAVGATEAAATALKLHPTDYEIQLAGCAALCAMFTGTMHETQTKKQMDRFVNSMDGIGLLMNTLTKFGQVSGVMGYGVAVFSMMATDKKHHRALLRARVSSTILKVSEDHPNIPSIHNYTRDYMMCFFSIGTKGRYYYSDSKE
jgi:hypothetical protein